MDIPKYMFNHDLKLYNLGDVHRGDPAHDNYLWKKIINKVHEDKNARWVSTGDLLNVALKNSKSDVYNSKNLNSEWNLLKKELAPISQKCLGFIKSNHHRRFDKETGLSLDSILADALKIPFLGGMGLIAVQCGRACYYIAMHHGTGGGKKRGSKTNNLETLGEVIPGADLYMEGHTHAFDHFINEVRYIDRKRGGIRQYKATFCVTGHFMEWEDSYAEDMKLIPRPKGCGGH